MGRFSYRLSRLLSKDVFELFLVEIKLFWN